MNGECGYVSILSGLGKFAKLGLISNRKKSKSKFKKFEVSFLSMLMKWYWIKALIDMDIKELTVDFGLE
jgi:hypothetical protein